MVGRDKAYDFWAQRGPLRWGNANSARALAVLEVRGGALSLLRPTINLAGLRRTIVFGATMIGSIVGGLDYWLIFQSKTDPGITITLLFVQVVVGAASLSAEERMFCRFAARHSPRPGLPLEVEHVQHGWYAHSMNVASQREKFELTIFSLPRRLRTALSHVKPGGNVASH